jgi:hypothetical protein
MAVRGLVLLTIALAIVLGIVVGGVEAQAAEFHLREATIDSVSHGRGHRFNPCTAHHLNIHRINQLRALTD